MILGNPMSAPPLTHHEILELVAPFTRRGRHVDLVASNRLERRLLFKPVDHAPAQAQPTLRETLQLEKLPTGTFRMVRVLRQHDGLEATLTAFGQDPAAMLEEFSTVDPRSQFRSGAGFQIARHYELRSDRRESDRGCAAQPILTQGLVQIAGLTLTFRLPSTRGVGADIRLAIAPGGDCIALPEDLLAVMGWDWARLIPDEGGWKSKLRLRGGMARRSRGAEKALERAAQHLVLTLAEPPCRFHERWSAARWGVVFRRSIPVLTVLSLFGAIAVLRHFLVNPNPGLRLLLFDAPAALIALSFCLQELPKYEIPPLPRRSIEASWHRPRQ